MNLSGKDLLLNDAKNLQKEEKMASGIKEGNSDQRARKLSFFLLSKL